jgi:hypothetical protein
LVQIFKRMGSLGKCRLSMAHETGIGLRLAGLLGRLPGAVLAISRMAKE